MTSTISPETLSRDKVHEYFEAASKKYSEAFKTALAQYRIRKMFPVTVRQDLQKLFVPTMNMMSDRYARMLLHQQKDVVQSILRIMLYENDLEITECETQQDLISSTGRSMVPDILARDTRQRIIILEIENDLSKAELFRLVYDAALARVTYTPTGGPIPTEIEVICIMVTSGMAQGIKYGVTYEKEIVEMVDGSQKSITAPDVHPVKTKFLYLTAGANLQNAKDHATEDDRYRLMQDFLQSDPSEMHFNFLFECNANLKFGEKGVTRMSDDVAQLFELLTAPVLRENTESVTKSVTDAVTRENAQVIATRFGMNYDDALALLTETKNI